MKYLLGSREMKALDAYTITQMQLPSAVLMERAALAVAGAVKQYMGRPNRVLVVCGSGNNGGDGFAVARLLLLEGIAADVFFAGKEESLTEETALQKKIYENYGGKLCRNFSPDEYNVVVDALFGIGLSREVTGSYAGLIGTINASRVPVVAVDMPSGISADTGQVLGTAVKADLTVTFAFPKKGQLLYPGADYCGRLLVEDIGITGHGMSEEERETTPFMYEREDLDRLPARKNRSHKGCYGRVLLIGGAPGMAGAPGLSAAAACRAGSGLVRIFSHEKNRSILQTAVPQATFSSWQEKSPEQELEWATVVGIGPGLGTGPESCELVKRVMESWEGPLVADADALNILSLHPEYMKESRARLILTPHPGEMARLSGLPVGEILANILETARGYGAEKNLVCVLKDARTAVSDGRRLYLNGSGNDGLATGGSGDVLTGVICGLLAQGADPFESACLGVYLHGLAGDAASARLGARSMTAADLPDSLGEVLLEAEKEEYARRII